MAILRYNKFLEQYRDRGLTDGSLRWEIFNAEKNGLQQSGALIRKGNRVFLDDDRYWNVYMRSGGGS